MSYLDEVAQAVRSLQEAGNSQLALLHCVSNYPASPADANLRALQTLAAALEKCIMAALGHSRKDNLHYAEGETQCA